MKLTISREELVQGLARVYGVADKQGSMPILANVLLETEGPGLRISATNLQLGVTTVIPASVAKEGAITAPAKTLFSIVKNLPQCEVKLSVGSKERIEVRGGGSKFRLSALPASDFPDPPSSNEAVFFSLDTKLLGEMIAKTYFSSYTGTDRPQINGVLFECDGDTMRMVATDVHCLSRVECPVDKVSYIYNFSALIPIGSASKVRSLCGEFDGVDIGLVDNSAFFKFSSESDTESNVSLSASLFTGRFPPYKKSIPSGSRRRASVVRDEFISSLKRAMLVGQEVVLTFQKDKIIITSANHLVGSACEEIYSTYSGEKTTIMFNGSYLIRALGALEDDGVDLEFDGPKDPLIFKEDDQLHLILPMRM